MALTNKDLTFVIKVQNQAKAALNALKGDLTSTGTAGAGMATNLNKASAALDKIKSSATSAASAMRAATEQTNKMSETDTRAAISAEKLALARAKTAQAQSNAAIASLREEDALNRSIALEARAIASKERLAAVSVAVAAAQSKTGSVAPRGTTGEVYGPTKPIPATGAATPTGPPVDAASEEARYQAQLRATAAARESARAAAEAAVAQRQQAAAAGTAAAGADRVTAADSRLTRAYDAVRDAVAAAQARMTGFGGGGVGGAIEGVRSRLANLPPILQTIGAFAGFGILSNGIRLVGAAFLAPFKAAADFEEQMKKVQAVAQATPAQLAPLSQAAKELGRSTQFGAVDAGAALQNLVQNGLSASQAIAALRPSADFATVGQLTLAESADVLTKTLAQYQLGVDQTAHATDVLNFINVKTNTDIKGLAGSLSYAGAVAHSFNVGLAETAAVLGVLGDGGIKNSAGGTAVRALLLDLSELANGQAPKKAQALLKNLKIDPKNIDPAKVGLTKALEVLKAANLSAAELNGLFQKRGSTPASILLAKTPVAGQDQSALDKAKALATQAEGPEAADFNKKQAAIINSSLNARIAILKGAFNGLAIAIGAITGPLADFVGGITAVVNATTSAVDYFNSATVGAYQLRTAIDTVLVGMAAMGLAVGVVAGVSALAAIGVEGIQIALLLAADGFVSAALAATGFTVALLANPLFTIPALIAIAVAAIYYFGNSLYQTSAGVVSGWTIIKAAFAAAYAYVSSIMNEIYNSVAIPLTVLSNLMGAAWDGIVSLTKIAWGYVYDAVIEAVTRVALLVAPITLFVVAIYDNWIAIENATSKVWASIQGIVIESIRNIVGSIPVLGNVALLAFNVFQKNQPAITKSAGAAGKAAADAYRNTLLAGAIKLTPKPGAKADKGGAVPGAEPPEANTNARFGDGKKKKTDNSAANEAQKRHDLIIKENLDLLAQEGLIGRVGVAREKFTKTTEFLNKIGLKGIEVDSTGTKIIGGLSAADTKLANSIIARISAQVDASRVDKIAQGYYEESTAAQHDLDDALKAYDQTLRLHPEALDAATRAVNKARIAQISYLDPLRELKQKTIDLIALSGLRATSIDIETKYQEAYNAAVARGDKDKAAASAEQAKAEYIKQAGAQAKINLNETLAGLSREVQLVGVSAEYHDNVSTILEYQNTVRKSGITKQLEINALTAKYIIGLQAVKDATDAANTNVGAGAREGLQQVADSFNNIRESTKSLVNDTFSSLSNNLQTFLKTGKFSLKAVLADLTSGIIKTGVQSLLGKAAEALQGKQGDIASAVGKATGQDVSPERAAGVELGNSLTLTATNVATAGQALVTAMQNVAISAQSVQPGAVATATSAAGAFTSGGIPGFLTPEVQGQLSQLALSGTQQASSIFIPTLTSGLAGISNGVKATGTGFLGGFGSILQGILAGLSKSGGGSGSGFLGAASSILGLLKFSGGGIMTEHGSIPLRKYSGGGIASSPQLAMFGEGSSPEAYVPVPSGRIPVEIKGLGNQNQSAGNIVIAPQITIPITGGGGGGDMTPAQADSASKALEGELGKYMEKWVQKEQRPGGRLNPNKR